jgi:hypothetical protein
MARNLLHFKKTLWLTCLAILGNEMKVESVFVKNDPYFMRCRMAAIAVANAQFYSRAVRAEACPACSFLVTAA